MRTKKRPPTHEMHSIKFSRVIHSYVPATEPLPETTQSYILNPSETLSPVNYDFHHFLGK